MKSSYKESSGVYLDKDFDENNLKEESKYHNPPILVHRKVNNLIPKELYSDLQAKTPVY